MSCSHKNCKLDIYHNNKCILHSDKEDKDINKFWKQIQKDLSEKYKCIQGNEELDNYEVIYEHVIFPIFQKDLEYDHIDPISETSNFYFTYHHIVPDGYCSKDDEEYEFTDKLIERCNVHFNHCTFLEEVNLQRYDFQFSVTFFDCTFLQEVYLSNTVNAQIDFRDCKFKNQVLDLTNKIFNESFFLIYCENIDTLNLTNTEFKNTTSFSGSKLKNIKFNETYFEGMSIFVKVHFLENTKFEYCTFEENVFFNDARIYKSIDIRHAIFKKEVTFLDIVNQDDKNLTSSNIANRETVRIIKHSFEKQDNIIEANKFYALEMQKREEELNDIKSMDYNFWERLVFKIHGISSNHSQDWKLALFWIIIFGFFSGVIDFYSINHNGNLPHITITGLFGLVVFLPILYWIYNQVRYFKKLILPMLFIVLTYSAYATLTHDYCLDIFYTKTINPFSIMKSEDPINIVQLIFKAIFAYLIYQFIISIRQNTRRK